MQVLRHCVADERLFGVGKGCARSLSDRVKPRLLSRSTVLQRATNLQRMRMHDCNKLQDTKCSLEMDLDHMLVRFLYAFGQCGQSLSQVGLEGLMASWVKREAEEQKA